jgi:hypothetical protein
VGQAPDVQDAKLFTQGEKGAAVFSFEQEGQLTVVSPQGMKAVLAMLSSEFWAKTVSSSRRSNTATAMKARPQFGLKNEPC